MTSNLGGTSRTRRKTLTLNLLGLVLERRQGQKYIGLLRIGE